MNPAQLDALLLEHNQPPGSDEQQLQQWMAEDPPSSVTVQGQQVYLFDLHLHMPDVPIEDSIVISQQLPGVYIPFHMHQYIELTYVYRGQCTVSLLNQQMVMQQGDLILIDKQTPHRINATSTDDIIIDVKLKRDYLCASLSSRLASTNMTTPFLIHSLIDRRRTNGYLYFKAKPDRSLQPTLVQIMCEYFDRDFCSAELIDSYCSILFTELVRHSSTGTGQEQPETRDRMVLDMLRYVREHYRDCNLIELAAQFDYHPNYVSAFLKKETGHSFMDLLQMERLNRAALFLTNSEMAIPAIAEEVGYSSPSFFHKKFKERFGSTPSHYRQHMRR
ncbi:AraC family transcriptional regulator [Paenibacillus wenxiniae]|uniref:AraC family transcriptional regulator n=1 Tax=Paenibacillus wenxiniae TaxID=1636843 RepID=A0ABW4RKG4_9BACL